MRSFSTSCFLLLILLISSCGNDKSVPEKADAAASINEESAFSSDTLKDIYVGKLNDKPMTLKPVLCWRRIYDRLQRCEREQTKKPAIKPGALTGSLGA